MEWIHPALGLVAVLLVLWGGWQGLTARGRRPEAPAARRRHRRLGPAAAVTCTLALVGGIASVLWLRDDMDLAATWHFRTGIATAALAVVAWVLSWQLHRHPSRKALHPWVGIALMGAALATFFLGLEHLP
ncbi:MAG: DUF4079 family protein [Alphaproteobacteria bacterium]|nr:DUF4079 family protein [Alphaproteobacteria bacterium]